MVFMGWGSPFVPAAIALTRALFAEQSIIWRGKYTVGAVHSLKGIDTIKGICSNTVLISSEYI